MKSLARILFLLSPALLTAQDSVSTRSLFKPRHLHLQFAGSIGLLSAGAGYSIFKGKGELDFLGGYLPKSIGGDDLVTATAKITYSPWRHALNPLMAWTPLTAGANISYTFGERFSFDLPSWYPKGYYWWNESTRFNVFLGGKILMTKPVISGLPQAELYYEIGTNELKLVSYVQNHRSLRFYDILHLGLGIKFIW